ncbi:Phosphate transport system permease protein PstC [Caulifigura coniformis]|uniref:Phosphate transport system permease protein n=1 Tax=Caulifigura coniformis TaxID=2527983 RepID=A0A517SGN8_9PLAN|nr:phosphate ABC transporter permease subunit PstC [Caulifigura coniformis]QDT55295.1 Phosphate transport system permease protein PstC [Caulifigura coniformis]
MSSSLPSPALPAPVDARHLQRRLTGRRFLEWIIQSLLFLCALASILTTLGILYMLASETIYSANPDDPAFFQQVSLAEFFGDTAWRPNFEPARFGIWPLLSGTFLITTIAGFVGLPIGILSAIYLSEYAKARTRTWVKPALELLAGVPTIVYGYFGLMFVTPYIINPLFSQLLGFEVQGLNALSGGIVVGLMLIPMVCSLSEDALRAVPRSLREAGYALGSTKFDVSVKVVVPAAFSGIVASFLLALSRAVGETMAVAIAAGNRPTLTLNPLESTQTMTSFIVNMTMGDVSAGTITYKSLFAVATCLFLVTLVMNVISQWVMQRYRETYQ